MQAATKLTEAARALSTQPTSVTLRYLQTLTEIGTEKNTTVVFPLPIDLFRGLAKWADQIGGAKQDGDGGGPPPSTPA